MLDGIPDQPVLFVVLVYDTKSVKFFSMCYHAIKWVEKTRQMYDPRIKMVHDAHFLCLNINESYNYNMNSVYLSDQTRNMYQVDQWVRKYKWW